MALNILSREAIKKEFLNGETPEQQDFHNWIDSFVHQKEDGITVTGGNVGIGKTNPGAKLSFGSDIANTKLALWESPDNKMRYGFGIQSQQLRIHVDQPGARFSFLNAEEGEEVVTIMGNGNVGIGIVNPDYKLDIQGTVTFRGTVKNRSSHFNFGADEHTYIRGGNNKANVIINDSGGNVGIGTGIPGAKLSFGSDIANTKLALWESPDNKMRYGFGIQSQQLRIHVDQPGARFSFLNAEEGEEVVTIVGNGNVGIGTANPSASIDVLRGKGKNGTAIFRGTERWSHFNYDADENTYIRGGKKNSNVFINDTGGKVLIGNTNVGLDGKFIVDGNSMFSGNVTIVGDLVVLGKTQKKNTDTGWEPLGSSDLRMKKDIMPFQDSLSLLKQINPVKFKYNGKGGVPESEEKIGIIAQEIQPLFPYMVFPQKRKLDETDAEETELLFFDGSALIYVAINAIKELNAKIEQLESKLKSSVSIA